MHGNGTSSSHRSRAPRPTSSPSTLATTRPNDEAKRNRDQESKRRNQRRPPDHNRKYPDSVEFGTISHSPDNDSDLTTRIKTVLGPCSSFFEKTRDVEDFVDANSKKLGVHWNARPSSRDHARGRRPHPAASSRVPAVSSSSSSSSSDKETLTKLFNSVKHVSSVNTSLASLRLSPLPKPPPTPPPPKAKSKNPTVSSQMGNGSTNPDISSIKPRKPTKLDTSDESSQIQITTISTTVQAPLWITAPVNRLRVISGLSKSITKRLRSSSRQDQYPPPKRARPDPSPTMPTVDSTQPSPVSAKTPPPGRPSSRGPTDFRTPTKKPRPKVHTDSPNKHQFPDSTVPGTGNYFAQQLPDSSSVNNVIGDYKEYYNNGLQLKDRAREQEDTRCYLSAFVTFTEALHNFNMAVYLLVNDLDRIVASGGKNNVEQSREIRKNAMKIADLIGNHNIKLCHKITNSEYGRKQKSLSESEQRIFEQLMIMCLRCESKLHLIVYKAQTAHQDHATSIQSNSELIRRIESAGTPEFRESEEVRLNKDQWKNTKFVINHFRNFQKAEMAWAAAERISRKNCKIHEDFFDNIRYLADVPKLTFYESSLKDLASYQRAMAGKLRDEIQSNPTLS